MTSITDALSSTPAHSHWERVGMRHHHGIVVPLFSLHSMDQALGTYSDLIPLIHWCARVGFDVIQLLPLNDTGHETSPYSALSAFALNPIHLDLSILPGVKGDAEFEELLLQRPRCGHNQLRVDYGSVREFNERFLRFYFQREGMRLRDHSSFLLFLQTPWLEEYALYRSLKAAHAWQSWESWESSLQNPSHEKYVELLNNNSEEVFYHSVVQYLCWSQWERVRAAADQYGILLKGDLPILINRDSADVWRRPALFDLQRCAGAPPDMYTKDGQNWGVPLYRWSEEKEALYNWWARRLESAAKLYHLYRLDHIIGFFRIWAVPPGRLGREGTYLPADWRRWIPEGEEKLRHLLSASSMLPIGEDLGVVPPQVRACMHRLGICGTKVMRWERNWEGDHSYINPEHYSALSLTTLSTHDSESLRQWWSDYPADVAALCNAYRLEPTKELTPSTHLKLLRMSHNSGSLWHVNLLSEYLGLFPEMRWEDPRDERVNIPGTVTDANWSCRLKPSVEEIVSLAEHFDGDLNCLLNH